MKSLNFIFGLVLMSASAFADSNMAMLTELLKEPQTIECVESNNFYNAKSVSITSEEVISTFSKWQFPSIKITINGISVDGEAWDQPPTFVINEVKSVKVGKLRVYNTETKKFEDSGTVAAVEASSYDHPTLPTKLFFTFDESGKLINITEQKAGETYLDGKVPVYKSSKVICSAVQM